MHPFLLHSIVRFLGQNIHLILFVVEPELLKICSHAIHIELALGPSSCELHLQLELLMFCMLCSLSPSLAVLKQENYPWLVGIELNRQGLH